MSQEIKEFGIEIKSGDIDGTCKCAQCGYKNKFIIKGTKFQEIIKMYRQNE